MRSNTTTRASPIKGEGGAYGYLGGLLIPQEYNLLTLGTSFSEPLHPGPNPIINADATAVVLGNTL